MLGCMENHFEKIQRLCISKNRIGPQGAKALAECFKNMKSLQVLDLSHDEIGDQGIETICS